MDVLEFVKAVNPADIRVSKMHGNTHDLTITIRKKIKSSPAEAIILAENLASFWPFCTYKVSEIKSGYKQIEVEYKIKRAEMQKFFSHISEILRQNDKISKLIKSCLFNICKEMPASDR